MRRTGDQNARTGKLVQLVNLVGRAATLGISRRGHDDEMIVGERQ
jgi:hypothetical protein